MISLIKNTTSKIAKIELLGQKLITLKTEGTH